MRLKYIETADFRKSEHTNFLELMKREKLELGPQDVVLLVNHGRNQLVFVYDIRDVTVKNGHVKEYKVLTSVRHRLEAGQWNPLMIRNYAEKAGLKLEGLRRFEDYYQDLLEARRGDRKS